MCLLKTLFSVSYLISKLLLRFDLSYGWGIYVKVCSATILQQLLNTNYPILYHLFFILFSLHSFNTVVQIKFLASANHNQESFTFHFAVVSIYAITIILLVLTLTHTTVLIPYESQTKVTCCACLSHSYCGPSAPISAIYISPLQPWWPLNEFVTTLIIYLLCINI